MAGRTDDDAAVRRRAILSALMDGEAEAPEHDDAFRAWREDDACRADWHAWQLIGDVLRREDLANPVERDVALVQAVRVRLVNEPVVLAPAEPAVASDRPAARPARLAANGGGLGAWARAHWHGPAAMAAGFVIVAGGLALRTPGTGSGAPVAAKSDAIAQAAAAPPATRERLAPYLAAHRQWAGAAAPIRMPDDGLRNAALTQPAR